MIGWLIMGLLLLVMAVVVVVDVADVADVVIGRHPQCLGGIAL